jgi:hypothetical protein
MVPIVWFFKSHPTVESSVLGAECVAIKKGIETWHGLRYKLRMMGASLSGPTHVYYDNMYGVHNTQHPETVLKKEIKHDVIPCGTRVGCDGRFHHWTSR